MLKLNLVLIAAAALAQPPSRPVPPEIEAEYYRADGVVAHMKPAWETANVDLQAAVAAVQKACGDKSQPALEGKHLVCMPKPEPAKEPTKPVKP